MKNHLKATTVNVRGLNSIKQKYITSQVAKSQYNVIFLQEIHVRDSQPILIKHSKFTLQFVAPGSSKSRGVTILLANHINFVQKVTIKNLRGQFIFVKGLHNGKPVTLSSIYALNTGQGECID